MKISTKRKLTLGFLGFIFIFSFILYDNNIGSTQVNKPSKENNYDQLNLKRSDSWNNFSFIHIIGSNWSVAVDYIWCTGSGSWADPYIIENITIEAGVSGSGITIENSSVYFRIENCTVYNSGRAISDAGIKLINTNNGTLLDNNCSSNENGIYLEGSNNNSISGNILEINDKGINLRYSNYTTILDNNITNNNNIGIHLEYSNNNSLSSNNVSEKTYRGIYLEHSNNNNLSGNVVSNNEHGIILSFSNYTTILSLIHI